MLAPAAGSSKTLRAVALAATLLVGACTGVEFPPPPEALPAKATPLAAVAIAPPVCEPIPPDITDAGDAAAYGAGQGAVGSVIVGAGSGGPWGLILGILLAPVAAITGAPSERPKCDRRKRLPRRRNPSRIRSCATTLRRCCARRLSSGYRRWVWR